MEMNVALEILSIRMVIIQNSSLKESSLRSNSRNRSKDKESWRSNSNNTNEFNRWGFNNKEGSHSNVNNIANKTTVESTPMSLTIVKRNPHGWGPLKSP